MAKKRRCKAKTKAGKACKARPLKGEDVCLAHADEKTRVSTSFQVGGGRPPKPRVVDVIRERIEADIERVLAPYFDALDNAVVHATHEGIVIPSDHPDLSARIAAAEKLLDRAYGRPRQAMEVSGEGGGPVKASIDVDDPEVRKLAGQLLRRRVEASRG